MQPIVGVVLALTACALLAAVPSWAGPAERNLSVGGLAASYLRPEGGDRVPIVVIIAGSGATDRDGNSAQGLRTDAYKQLAHALSDQGIASVRYDKRGVGGSLDLARDEQQLTIEVFAKDALVVAAWAGQQPGVRAVVLVGHSEGGVLALMCAKQAKARGLVLLSTPGRPLGAILRDQLARPGLPDDLRTEALQIIAALERGEEVKSVRADLEPLFRRGVQPFLKSWIRTDPVQLLRGLDSPALVVAGGRDIQVGRADFDALAGARGKVTSHWVPDMGHTLKLVGADVASQGRAYVDPTLPLADGLADRVAAFVHEVTAVAPGGRK